MVALEYKDSEICVICGSNEGDFDLTARKLEEPNEDGSHKWACMECSLDKHGDKLKA